MLICICTSGLKVPVRGFQIVLTTVVCMWWLYVYFNHAVCRYYFKYVKTVFHCDVFLVALPNVFWQPALYPVIPSSLWLWLHSTGRLPGQWWPVNKMTRMKPCWSCGVVISEAMPQQWHCRGGGRRLCLIYVRWNCIFNLFVYSVFENKRRLIETIFLQIFLRKKSKCPVSCRNPVRFNQNYQN